MKMKMMEMMEMVMDSLTIVSSAKYTSPNSCLGMVDIIMW